MADRGYESGRARSSHTDPSRSRRSPPIISSTSSAYPNYPPGFSSHGRPSLPPLSISNSPPRGMPASGHGLTTYRPHTPGRFDDAPAMSSHYHSSSNPQSTGWSTERQVESRGLPSQPAWPAYPAQTGYDPRYVNQQQPYYQPTQQLSPQDAQRRLPPLHHAQDDTHYLPSASAGRSQIGNPYSSPQSTYPMDSRSSRYSPPHYPPSQPTSSRHHSSSYAGGTSHTIPIASAEWGGSVSPGHARHDDPIYGSPGYGYPQQDRDAWSELQSPTDPRSEEPLIKKKRKRADANQLRVLNATYQRTAFPSTQERESLAKELDMSPRSVQIWFQNKRQSMRQSRNSASNLPPILHNTYSTSASPPEPKPNIQPYHTLGIEASPSRRREGTPSDGRRR